MKGRTIQARFTASEWAQLTASVSIDEDGVLRCEIPESALHSDGPRLLPCPPLLVRYGDLEAELNPLDHALFAFAFENDGPTHEEAVDAVWFGREVSESAIRNACTRISTAFFDSGIPFRVSAKGGRIQIISDPAT